MEKKVPMPIINFLKELFQEGGKGNTPFILFLLFFFVGRMKPLLLSLHLPLRWSQV